MSLPTSFASYLSLALAMTFLTVPPTRAADDIVTVESGKLQGTTNADRSVRIFKGIPFAAPPVGDLR